MLEAQHSHQDEENGGKSLTEKRSMQKMKGEFELYKVGKQWMTFEVQTVWEKVY